MRGSRTPAVRSLATDSQAAFRALSRHRRAKLAHDADTTLVTADRWGRGAAIEPKIATALDAGLSALRAKYKG